MLNLSKLFKLKRAYENYSSELPRAVAEFAFLTCMLKNSFHWFMCTVTSQQCTVSPHLCLLCSPACCLLCHRE